MPFLQPSLNSSCETFPSASASTILKFVTTGPACSAVTVSDTVVMLFQTSWHLASSNIGSPRRGNVHVTGVTLSAPQREYASARLERYGLASQADIRLQDYQDVQGAFDRIVSIEMLEAVGEAYWPQYFSKLRECLAPGGSVVLQVICIAPDRYQDYRHRPDFIQTHIFPGGALPTSDIVLAQAVCAGLKATSVEMFGPSYASTLADCHRRANAAALAQEGFWLPTRRLPRHLLCDRNPSSSRC